MNDVIKSGYCAKDEYAEIKKREIEKAIKKGYVNIKEGGLKQMKKSFIQKDGWIAVNTKWGREYYKKCDYYTWQIKVYSRRDYSVYKHEDGAFQYQLQYLTLADAKGHCY